MSTPTTPYIVKHGKRTFVFHREPIQFSDGEMLEVNGCKAIEDFEFSKKDLKPTLEEATEADIKRFKAERKQSEPIQFSDDKALGVNCYKAIEGFESVTLTFEEVTEADIKRFEAERNQMLQRSIDNTPIDEASH